MIMLPFLNFHEAVSWAARADSGTWLRVCATFLGSSTCRVQRALYFAGFSALSGTTASAALKPILECVPSQKGLFV
jgi:hypothetical protein